MKRIPAVTALHTRCAYAQVCAATCTGLFMGICVQEDMEVQV